MAADKPYLLYRLTNPPQRRHEDVLDQELGEEPGSVVFKSYLQLADRAVGRGEFTVETRRSGLRRRKRAMLGNSDREMIGRSGG